MTGQEAFTFLRKAGKYIDASYGYGLISFVRKDEFGRPVSVYAGHTEPPELGDIPKFVVGYSEFYDNRCSEVPDMDVAASIVTLFHEAVGHGFQHRVVYQKENDPLCSVLAMNFCACQASPRYYSDYSALYDSDSPYFMQCYEMAAQYLGLKCAYEYLKSFDSLPFDVEKSLCDYENKRRKGSDFIKFDEDFDTVDDILDVFESQFVGVVHGQHDYHFSRSEPGDLPFGLLEGVFSDDAFNRRSKRLSNCSDGMKQDQMAASIFVDRYPQNKFPALSGIELRPDKAFGYFSEPMKPMPPDSVLKLSHLVELMDDERNNVWPDLDGPE